MGWQTINYPCGHSENMQMYGKMDSRSARVARMERDDCPACRAAGSTLQGSVKQIARAEDIKAKAMPKVEAKHAELTKRLAAYPAPEDAKAYVQAAMDAALDTIRSRKLAEQWIDDQSPEMDIYDAMREAMTAASRQAAAQ